MDAMNLVKLFGEHEEPLYTDEAVHILQNILRIWIIWPAELVSNLSPVKPKGGQM